MNRLIASVVLPILFFSSCKNEEIESIYKLEKPKVIAHRGFWQSGCKENSIDALFEVENILVYGSEFDVSLTKDFIPIISHDKEMNGLKIHDVLFQELADAGEVVTLSDFLDIAKNTKEIKLILDLKPHSSAVVNRESARVCVDLIKQKKLENRVIYLAFSISGGKELVRLAPDANVFYLGEDLSPKELKAIGFSGMGFHYNVLKQNNQWVKEAKELGLGINVWTVNDTTLMREMIDYGVDFITTDKPIEALQIISAVN